MPSQYFNEQHEIFRKSVREFVEKELAPHADEWEEKEDFPTREIFKKVGELGFLGLRFPEKYGGSEADFFTEVVFVEEIGRCNSGGVAMSILVQAFMTLPYINSFGTEEQKLEYLVPGIKGEKIAAIGVTEPDAGSDVAGIKTTAVRDGNNYIINGSKIFITNGCKADFVIVAAKTKPEAGHNGISLFLVDSNTPGFSVGKRLKKLGNKTSDTAELFFSDVKVPANKLLGGENMGFFGIMKHFQEERLVAAIAAASDAKRLWELGYKYALERKAFGRPIGKFQANRHKLVEMLAEVESAQQYTYYACWLFDKGIDCIKEVSMAKYLTSELINKIAYNVLQLHGGYGYMDEYLISRAYRDVRLLTIGGGTSEIMKEIVGKLLGL